jgi:hypothetical protein
VDCPKAEGQSFLGKRRNNRGSTGARRVLHDLIDVLLIDQPCLTYRGISKGKRRVRVLLPFGRCINHRQLVMKQRALIHIVHVVLRLYCSCRFSCGPAPRSKFPAQRCSSKARRRVCGGGTEKEQWSSRTQVHRKHAHPSAPIALGADELAPTARLPAAAFSSVLPPDCRRPLRSARCGACLTPSAHYNG